MPMLVQCARSFGKVASDRQRRCVAGRKSEQYTAAACSGDAHTSMCATQ